MNEGHDSINKGALFHSKDIGKKPKSDPFVKVETGARKEAKKTKILRIAAVVAGALAGIVLVGAVIFVISKITHQSWVKEHDTSYTESDIPETYEEIEKEAWGIVYNTETGGYGVAVSYVQTAINYITDDVAVMRLKMLLARFNIRRNRENEARDIIETLAAKEDSLSDEEKYYLYESAIFVYRNIGNDGLVREYRDKKDVLDVEQNHAEGMGAEE